MPIHRGNCRLSGVGRLLIKRVAKVSVVIIFLSHKLSFRMRNRREPAFGRFSKYFGKVEALFFQDNHRLMSIRPSGLGEETFLNVKSENPDFGEGK